MLLSFHALNVLEPKVRNLFAQLRVARIVEASQESTQLALGKLSVHNLVEKFELVRF